MMTVYNGLMLILGISALILTWITAIWSPVDSNNTKWKILNSGSAILTGIVCAMAMLLCVGRLMLDTQEWEYAEEPYKVERLVGLNDNADINYRIASYKKQRHWLWFSEEDIFYKIYVPNRRIQEENTLK